MRYAFLKAATTMFSIALLTACHAQTPSKPERDLNAIVEIPFGIPSLNQTTTLRIPEGYIDRWVMGEKIEPYPSSIQLRASGIDLLPKRADTLDDFKDPRVFTQIISIELGSNAIVAPTTLLTWDKTLSGEYIKKYDSCQFMKQNELRYGLSWEKVNLLSCMNILRNPDKDLSRESSPDKFFIENTKKQVTTSIWCLSEDFKDDGTYINGTKTSNNPSCEHLFFDEKMGMFLKFNYSRQFLPHWKQIQNNALKLVQTFLPQTK